MTLSNTEKVNFSHTVTDIYEKGIYVIHALKGYEYHERRIIDLFGKMKMSFEFVTDGDPKYFGETNFDKYFVSDIQSKLSNGVLSCTLNHIMPMSVLFVIIYPTGLFLKTTHFFLVISRKNWER